MVRLKLLSVLSYTLGAMYAAQYFATIRKAQPSLDQQIAQGQFEPCFDWLKQNIWSRASRYDTNELVTRATGETLNPQHYRAHLESRYLG
jgi:carboxypeptidase Taq